MPGARQGSRVGAKGEAGCLHLLSPHSASAGGSILELLLPSGIHLGGTAGQDAAPGVR